MSTLIVSSSITMEKDQTYKKSSDSIAEKLDAQSASINNRSELISTCRHSKKFLLKTVLA